MRWLTAARCYAFVQACDAHAPCSSSVSACAPWAHRPPGPSTGRCMPQAQSCLPHLASGSAPAQVRQATTCSASAAVLAILAAVATIVPPAAGAPGITAVDRREVQDGTELTITGTELADVDGVQIAPFDETAFDKDDGACTTVTATATEVLCIVKLLKAGRCGPVIAYKGAVQQAKFVDGADPVCYTEDPIEINLVKPREGQVCRLCTQNYCC